MGERSNTYVVHTCVLRFYHDLFAVNLREFASLHQEEVISARTCFTAASPRMNS